MIDHRDILTRVAAVFDIPILAILSRSRRTRFTPARQAVCYALRAEGYTYREIGDILCRDHTTVIYSYRQAEQRAESDPAYAAQLRAVMADDEPAPALPSRQPIALDDLAWRDWTTKRLLRRWGGSLPHPATA